MNRFSAFCYFLLFSFSLFSQNGGTFFIKIDAYPSISSTCCTAGARVTVSPASPSGCSYWYIWSNGATAQNLSNLCAGTYTVTVSDCNGMTNTASVVLGALYQPFITSGNFTPCNIDSLEGRGQCERVCPNTTATYYIEGLETQLTLAGEWSVQGARSYTVRPDNSVTVQWGASGRGVLRYNYPFSQATNTTCALAEKCVLVIDAPDAGMTSLPAATQDTISVCTGQTVYFQNQSKGADIVEWQFGDDLSSSNLSDLAHVFKTPGIFTTRLIVRSSCLCADTAQVIVRVADAAGPTLDCVGTTCPGETVTYTASGACPPFQWQISSNGSIVAGGTAASDSISVRWNNGPAGTIRLGGITCSGAQCRSAAEVRVPVLSDNATIKGKNRVCPASLETYSIEAYGGTGYIWKLSGGGQIKEGQGTNKINIKWNDTPSPDKDMWLVVEYDNCYLGCKGTDSLAIRVVPQFFIEAPIEACESKTGLQASTDVNTRTFCDWKLTGPNGNGVWASANPSALIQNVPLDQGGGLYVLTATAVDPTKVCNAYDDHVIQVTAKPPVPTGIDGSRTICPGTYYTYKALPEDPKYNLEWSFKNYDGSYFYVSQNPVNHLWNTITTPLSVSVRNVTADGLLCPSDTIQIQVKPLAAPVIKGDGAICASKKGVYQVAPQENADIRWAIVPASAGLVSKGQGTEQVEIFWTQPGNHQVEVRVCNQNSTFPVTVHATPVPIVQHINGVCPGQIAPVKTAASYSAYTWATESGTVISAFAQPSVSAGVYALTVVDAHGCTGATQFTIKEYPLPNVTATTADPTGFCQNSRYVTITALTENDSEYKYEWFKGGNAWGGNNKTLTTNQYGTYSVQVTNQYGCTASDGDVLVFEYCAGVCHNPSNPPRCQPGDMSFKIQPTSYCDSFHFELQPGPLYLPGNISWGFGKSGNQLLGNSTEESPSYKFPNAGKYIVFAYANLTNGATCLLLDSVQVAAAAQLDTLIKCAGTASTFLDESTFLPDGGIQKWEWDFGDPSSGVANTETGRNPMHTFAAVGNYLVTLTVTAQNGCMARTKSTVAVPGGTRLLFVPPAARCADNPMTFELPPVPGISKVGWTFGDLSSGTANSAEGWSVAHTYKNTATYQVSVTTTNIRECTAVFSQNITVMANSLTGSITPANPPAICEGKTLALTAPSGGTQWLWSDKTTITRTFTASKEGIYRVTLTDQNGCTYTPPAVRVSVNAAPDVRIQGLLLNKAGDVTGVQNSAMTICKGEDVFLRSETNQNGLGSYRWSNGLAGTILSFTADRGNSLPVGTHSFTVTVTGSQGCTAVSLPYTVTVNPVPAPFYVNAGGYCAGTPLTIKYNGPALASDDRLIWNTGKEGPELTTTEAGNYSLTVVNRYSCATKSNEWQVRPGPNLQAVPAGCYRRCRPDTLCMPALPNIVSWQWFYNGTAISGATTARLVAPVSGTYYAQLKDIYGCAAQTGPLNLELYEGFGNITGKVWADVNKNGQIDAADTLVSGIALELLLNNAVSATSVTNAGGQTAFIGVKEGQYQIQTGTLPAGWTPVIQKANAEIVGCKVQKNCDLLIVKGCLSSSAVLNLTVCPGATIQYQNVTLGAGDTHDFILKNAEGCDSTLHVEVKERLVGKGQVRVMVCAGGTFLYQNTPVWAGETRDFTVTTAQGCDSVVQVQVVARTVGTDTLRARVCMGERFVYQSTPVGVGETRDFTLQTSDGCDSVVTVQVAAYAVPASSFEVRVCAGSSFSYLGQEVAAGTTRTFTMSSWRGCDSTVTVKVTEKAAVTHTMTVHICADAVYLYQNTALIPGQSEIFTLKTPTGCDSVVTVNVLPLARSTSALHQKVCAGETFTYYGIELRPGDVQVFDLTSWRGCDSLVTVSVEAYAPPVPVVLRETICPGTTFDYQGKSWAPGDSAVFTLSGWQGCDSVVVLQVSAWPATTFDLAASPSCTAQPTGNLYIRHLSGGTSPHRFSLDGNTFASDSVFASLSAGSYTIQSEDARGCRARRDTVIRALEPLQISVSPATLHCDSAEVTLSVAIRGDTSGLKYLWWNGSTAPSVSVATAGRWQVEVKNVCETLQKEAVVDWGGIGEGREFIYVPNVFQPSATRESRNALFMPAFSPDSRIVSYRLEVYDRWGSLVYRTTDPAAGWDGRIRSRTTSSQVFVWHLTAFINFCGREIQVNKKGDVVVTE